MTDRRLLYAAAFLRAIATGMIAVLLAIYLARRSFEEGQIGLVVSAGLAGGGLGVLGVTVGADRFGRRQALLALTALGVIGGLALTAASHPAAAALAALFGMVNGMGRDRGPALVIEQAILPTTTEDQGRTRAFAWYNVVQDAGHAIGGGLGALPLLLSRVAGLDDLTALRSSLLLYPALLLVTFFLYARLSPAAEAHAQTKRTRLAPESRVILWKISSLFALDSLGGGFLAGALLSYFFFERFGVGPAAIGALFFAARLANAASHLAAAWLAQRIGLVRTMVLTHIPSSLLLMTVPLAPSFPVAALLFVLRECLVEMDVPTRQSYVMAVVRPEERTTASGITHLVRMAGWAAGPALAGFLMQDRSVAAPLFVGAGMKIVYDLLLWRAFRAAPAPEEGGERTLT